MNVSPEKSQISLRRLPGAGSAGFQPAVAPNFIRQTVRRGRDSQIENLRYSRLENLRYGPDRQDACSTTGSTEVAGGWVRGFHRFSHLRRGAVITSKLASKTSAP